MFPTGLESFLDKYPNMHLSPTYGDEGVFISGVMNFNLVYKDYPPISTEYDVSISIPKDYPKQSPVFNEISHVIPKTPDYHINADGSLCLGSPLRLNISLKENPDIEVFCRTNLEPYIYAVTLKIENGLDWVFGELAHGAEGEIEDYAELFGIKDKDKVLKCLIATSNKKRVANKYPCPCGCIQRLGKCQLHIKINQLRYQVGRRFVREAWMKLK